MSKFGGSDFILAIQDRKDNASVGVDKPLVTRESKQTITDSAMNYAGAKNIPFEHRFSTRRTETTDGDFLKGWWPPNPNPNRGKFSPLGPQSLARLTERDKLFIFAHGNAYGVAYMADDQPMAASQLNALAVAKLLKDSGLTRVGLITFKACLVGQSGFLRDFAIALAGKGIAAGWLKGYKGLAATVPKTGGGFTEEVTRRGGVVLTSSGPGVDVVNNARYRIVRGPGGLFEGSNFGRYHGTTTQAETNRFAEAQLAMADQLDD